MIENFSVDILRCIFSYVSDTDIIMTLSTETNLDMLKNRFVYIEPTDISSVKNLWYVDKFNHICVHGNSYTNALHLEKIRNVKCLLLCGTYKRDILGKFLSLPNIQYLQFGDDFCQDIRDYVLPSVSTLIFGNMFNRCIDKCIPNSVVYLEFGFLFNCPIKNNIPPSVKHLVLGYCYQYDIKNSVPTTVTNLTLKFNSPIANLIPTHIINLCFGDVFNQNINGHIPPSVRTLVLGEKFSHKIDNKTLLNLRLLRVHHMYKFDLVVGPKCVIEKY